MGLAGGRERVPHGVVALLPGHALVVAVVVLEVVHAPGREAVGVLLFVVEAAGVVGTGGDVGALVDAELESLAVDVRRCAADPAGELDRVGDQRALGIPGVGHPAVVDVDVGVPGVLEAGGDEVVGGLLDELLGDVAAEGVPVVPAHRRGLREAVVERGAACRGGGLCRGRSLRHGRGTGGGPRTHGLGARDGTEDDQRGDEGEQEGSWASCEVRHDSSFRGVRGSAAEHRRSELTLCVEVDAGQCVLVSD